MLLLERKVHHTPFMPMVSYSVLLYLKDEAQRSSVI